MTDTFKTPKALGLTPEQFAALEKTLCLLESGTMTHVSRDSGGKRVRPNGPAEFTAHFDMRQWRETRECGTVCCIGGTAELVGGLPFGELSRRASEIKDGNYVRAELHELFFPDTIFNWSAITPQRAAKALRGYLETGITKWT